MAVPIANLVTRLKAISAVTTLVGSGNSARIRPMMLNQADTTKPAICYQQVSDMPLSHLKGDVKTAEARFQLTMIASTYLGAHTLADAVRGDPEAGTVTGLSGFVDADGNVWHLAMEMDQPGEIQEGTGRPIAYAVIQDYYVWHN